MVDARHRSSSVSEPEFSPNPSEMPGRNLPDSNEAARISNMIDEELKVWSFNLIHSFI
jgi:hypothetical protein